MKTVAAWETNLEKIMESEFLVMELQLMINWEQTRETEVQQSKGENDTKNARILLICLFNFHVSLETENLKKSEILQLQCIG
ncbi:hypothetical protein T09_8027 [Trichinella sp. T9]|nr:hypothetical protein T09_8027 [Trichinella sp. T9]